MFVSVIAIRGLLTEAQRRGVAAGEILTGPTAHEGFLSDMRSVIPETEFDAILDRAIRLTGDEGLGLSVGMNAPESTFQIIAHLVLAAPTLADAFDMLERYSPLLMEGLSISLTRSGSLAQFRYHFHAGSSARSARYGAECMAATILRFATHFVPNLALTSLAFEHIEPSYGQRYRSLFGCPVRFGQRDNCAEFDAAALTVRQPHADLAMAQVLRNAAEQLLSTAGPRASLGDRLRAVLRRERDLCAVDTDRLAREIGVSQRALRRRLSAEGLSVSQLLEEARCTIACEELRRPGGSIKDVADRLGYSEPSAFHRAFKRWTGQTPAAYVRGVHPNAILDESYLNAAG
jgi:AraC-like DNA-binding protein